MANILMTIYEEVAEDVINSLIRAADWEIHLRRSHGDIDSLEKYIFVKKFLQSKLKTNTEEENK